MLDQFRLQDLISPVGVRVENAPVLSVWQSVCHFVLSWRKSPQPMSGRDLDPDTLFIHINAPGVMHFPKGGYYYR